MARLHIHSKIVDALRRGTPVVALESAVITTGLPREPLEQRPPGADDHWRDDAPANVEAARLMRRMISSAGAVPAVIAVLDGHLHIGLDDDQLDALATDENAGKVAASTLAHAIITGRTGGTTVSATIAAMGMTPELGSDLAPIRFFATGGIGGVHRGWNERPDVSNDLRQLATSPVCVVSAGAKSLLDLNATVEVMEALGVPIVGFGSDMMPKFYTRGDASLTVPLRTDSAEEAAELCRQHWRHATLRTGVLVANPIPEDAAIEEADDSDALDQHIKTAEAAATRAGVSGPARTPFVLKELASRTSGRTLHANVALLASNAKLAAEIAVNWAKREG